MNLYHNQASNVWKTWALMATFLGLVIAIGWFISFYYDSPTILYIAAAFAFFMNFFSYWYSASIVLKLHKAKPVTREEYFDLWNITENLSITAGLPMPKLYIVEDPMPNAFATGRNKEHGVVAVTTGLLQILDKQELEGVIAHELAHIGNRDILLQTVVVVLVGFLAILSDIFIRSHLWGGRGRNGGNKGGGIIIIIGFILVILAPIAATLIRLAISRKREFLADATGALLTRYPEGLANALRKISSAPKPMKTARDATAHMFISNPFGGEKTSGFHKLFLTHPPTEQRIAALLDKKQNV
jgi:heat shock protein HtpX